MLSERLNEFKILPSTNAYRRLRDAYLSAVGISKDTYVMSNDDSTSYEDYLISLVEEYLKSNEDSIIVTPDI